MAKKWHMRVGSMPEENRLRFGIVGCGTASLPVCEAIRASTLATLAAVYDVNATLADDVQRRFQVRKTNTLDELLTDSSVDAVYIAVPHYLLAPLTERALQAGKHALTEKPLAISLEEVDRLITLAAERELALGVFFEMRYAPAHTIAHQLVQTGAIGEIIGVHIQTLIDKPIAYWQAGYSARSINPWRGIKAQAGGGVLLMNTSHLLDAVLYVTGLTVTSVTAQIGTLVADVEVEDMASASLRFDNGAIGSILAGAHIAGAQKNECCCLYGTQGQIRLPDPYGSGPLQMYLKRSFREYDPGQWYSLPTKPVPVYARAIEDFVRAVQKGQCPPVDAIAAGQVLAIVLAIYQSAAEQRMITIS